MSEENKASRPLFDEILDVYFKLQLAGYTPAKARRIINLYLE